MSSCWRLPLLAQGSCFLSGPLELITAAVYCRGNQQPPMVDHIQPDLYAISPVKIHAYTLIKTKVGSVGDMLPFMTGILFRHIEYVYSMYESSWNFPLTRYTWMLDAFPSKTLWREERLLLSILHWYSLTFRYKRTSDTKAPISGDCAHQGSLLCGRVRSQSYFSVLNGGSPPLLCSVFRKHGCQYATIYRFWTWTLKRSLDIYLRVCPGQEEGSRRWCVASKQDVLARESPSCSVYFANQFTFPDPVLPL